MKKFVNEIENVLQESLQGFCNAHSELLEYQNDPCFVFRKDIGRLWLKFSLTLFAQYCRKNDVNPTLWSRLASPKV